MSKARDKVIDEMENRIVSGIWEHVRARAIAENLLTILGLAIVDRKATVPDCPYGAPSWTEYERDFYRHGQQSLVNKGWLKEVK